MGKEGSSVQTHDARQRGISRRGALQAGIGVAIWGTVASRSWQRRTAPSNAQATDQLFHELDARIEAGMAQYHIPGVAVGILYQGEEYLRGYGVTNVDYPQ